MVSITVKREHVFSLYQLFHLNRGHTDENSVECTRYVRIVNFNGNTPHTWNIRHLKFEEGEDRTGFHEYMAGYVIHWPTAVISVLFSALSPKVESWHPVFVTTKLREKFVAHIPAAGARSHAKGETKKKRKIGGEDVPAGRRDEDRRNVA